MCFRIVFCWFVCLLVVACKQAPPAIEFQLFANGEKVLSILPEDIAYYDTSKVSSGGTIEIHEMRLRESFYQKDSLVLTTPLYLYCQIDGKQYFWSDLFYATQSRLDLNINFKFHASCSDPEWTFMKQKKGQLVLKTNNSCNSILFMHSKDQTEKDIEVYYKKYNKVFIENYLDTARLAHEILYDPYYLNALKAAGVELK